MIQFIDLKSQQDRIREGLKKRLDVVFDHNRYIMGPEVLEFEEVMSKYTGSKYAFGVSSGTDALLISLMALGVGPGDEVIVPDFTFFATASMAMLLGAKPVTIDVDPISYNMDHTQIEAAITAKTKAIVPVGLYGQPAAMDEINVIAQQYGIPVIEDACQSFGARYKGKMSCNLSTIACTSFFPTKPLGAYGDGGAVFTNDRDLADKIKLLRDHGLKDKRYNHVQIGLNGRLDTFQAAILLEKMIILDDELKARNRAANYYSCKLKDKFIIPHISENVVSAWAQYTIQVNDREQFIAKAADKGLPLMVHYPCPLSKQPALETYNMKTGSVSLELSKKVVSLPMHPYLTEEIQDHICDVLLRL